MKSREFKKIYHPRMGNGLIVDNLMKSVKKIASALVGQVVKPFAKRAIQAGVSQAGEKVGTKAADKGIEKSGELIRKRMSKGKRTSGPTGTKKTRTRAPKTADEVNTLINNLIA